MLSKKIANKQNLQLTIIYLNCFYISYFLYRLFTMSGIAGDRFVVLVAISWIGLNFITKQSTRITILFGILLLLLTPVSVIWEREVLAQNSAIFAFLFIAIGVLSQFVGLVGGRKHFND